MSGRLIDHIDLRVSSLAKVSAFYERLLPELGFSVDARIEGWLQFEALDASGEPGAFFGVTESAGHVPNENRVAFWAGSVEEVDRLARVVVEAGGCQIEGPGWEDKSYYAVFFEDPDGNRLEICHRLAPVGGGQ
ncbi:glyoxalase [Phragmitibacter flavus]|uniref:Glyoxalase n=1 Tax=Phragmitibacter flavus TaxID=2576071 RepID=A0A5R8K9D5_9BACT|nr:VOC family protein [Phragmitibacter flavus]TLD68907.1 glyoxalase [Phragmitibacter flavus]